MKIGRRPLTAAAAKVTVTADTNRKIVETPEEERLWDAYDRLPELHYGVSIRGNIANRFDYFPARRATPVSEPDRIGEVDEGESVPAADQAVVDVFENEGGADLLRRLVTGLVVHWDVTGLAYVVATSGDDRTWQVLSSQELKKRSDGNFDRLNSSGDVIPGETLDKSQVYLVWRPHPRNSRKPDSPLRSSLEVAEQLILLNREMRARSLSRIGAGILWLSDGMDFTDPNGDPIDEQSFEQMLMDRLTRPIKDSGSAGSVAPWVLKANPDDIKAATHQTFDRDWEVSRDDREELIRRLANGMDLPPEILLGVADLNHWSLWGVQESTVSQHVDPTVRTILDSLTTGWFVPLLLAAGLDEGQVDGVVLWRDISPAVVPADNSDQHFTALQTGVIGFVAARERLGYDQEEAPTEEDLALIARIGGSVPDDGPVSDRSDPLPESEDDREAAMAVETFQAAPNIDAGTVTARTVDLGELAIQDAATLDYVLTEAEAALDRLIEKAAARARSQMQGRASVSELRMSTEEMLRIGFGPYTKIAWSGTFQTNELIRDDDLTPVIARIRRRLARAQDDARDTFATLVEAEPQTRSPEEDEDLDSGLSLLSLILLAAAAAALTTPGGEPDPVDVGEVRDLRLPVTEIRDAISTVGGGVPEYDNIISWELIGNGRRTQQRLSDAGASSLQFTWLYGNPAARVTNFDPHVNLNGVTFTEWDDPELSVTADGAWTGVTHYRPGDHRGCLCQYRRTVTLPVQAVAAAAIAEYAAGYDD